MKGEKEKKKDMTLKKKPASKKTSTRKKRIVSTPVAEVVQPIETPNETSVEVPEVKQEVKPVLDIPAQVIEYPVYKRPGQLLLIALLLGWIFNFLFWNQSVGVNFAIVMSVSLLGGTYWLGSNGSRPARNTLWLLTPFLFFVVITAIRQEPLTLFLAFTFTILSAGLFASSFLGGRWIFYGLSDYFNKSMHLIIDLFSEPLGFFLKALKYQAEQSNSRKTFPIWGLLRGLVIALPIVLCFGSLLAAGDIVFREKLGDFFGNFRLDNIAKNIAQGILIAFYAYLMIGTFLHAAFRSRDEKLVGEDKPFIKSVLGFPETVVILGSVSLLFLAFVIVQFQYFFGGQSNIGVAGFTYSEYARRGFNELIAVALFSLILILGLSTLTRRDTEIQKRIYSGLSIAIVILVLVILISAYQRISLAIGWHGFSRLRLYPRLFLIWLGILLVAVVALEVLRKERYFAFAAVLACVGFSVSLTLVNVDTAIVKHNIPRVLPGKNLNVAHLASLSWDAVPALVDAFQSDTYPQQTHEGIGAILTCYLHYDSLPGAYRDNWRSFNLSRWKAHIALNQVELSLQEYGIKVDRTHLEARTPSKVWYDCKDYQEEE